MDKPTEIVDRSKLIFTASEVGRLAGVSTATVCRWIDSKELDAYKLPTSQHRRIPRVYLVRFLKKNGMATPGIWTPEDGAVEGAASEREAS